MANLTRWSPRMAPRWLGNDRDAHPFTLQYRRLTRGELVEFSRRLEELQNRGGASANDLAALYEGAVRGPYRAEAVTAGPALTIDDVAVQEGDLASLLRCGLEEGPKVHGRLIQEIIDTLFEVNGLTAATLGESSSSRGGASTTRADRSEASTPAPAVTA